MLRAFDVRDSLRAFGELRTASFNTALEHSSSRDSGINLLAYSLSLRGLRLRMRRGI